MSGEEAPEIPARILEARKAMEDQLFFKDFQEYVKTKFTPRQSRERYGRENIVGVGIGWKNWPEFIRRFEDNKFAREIYLRFRTKRDWRELFELAHVQLYERFSSLMPSLSEDFGKWCVRVLVEKKAPEDQVDASLVVSRVMKQTGYDFPTDVVEVGEVAFAANNAVYRPLTFGVSGGHGIYKSGGTLGCMVHKGHQDLVLSCNHVLANYNQANKNKDPVVQPSLMDNGNLSNRIGRLSDFTDLDFAGGVNYIDAALAEVDSSIQVSPSMEGASFVPKGNTLPKMDQKVKKVGRTTGLTIGQVNGVNLGMQGIPIPITYGHKVARFADIFSIGHTYLTGGPLSPIPFANSGDSGSLIVEDESGGNQAVGILFSISGPYMDAYGCTFSRISNKLGISL